MKQNNFFRKFTVLSTSFWLIAFVLVPNIIILFISFMERDVSKFVKLKLTLSNYYKILDPIYFKVFINSLLLALVTTGACIIIAFPFAYIISKAKNNIKNILLLMIIVPFWTSALIRTYAINAILTTHGVINYLLLKLGITKEPLSMLYTNGAVIYGLIYALLPFMILPIYTSMIKMDFRYIEAAQDLGASKLKVFTRIIIPLTAPGIVAGSIMVFLPALGLFYIPDMLGGAKSILIGNLIKSSFLELGNWPFGAAVSMVLTLFIALLLIPNVKIIKNMTRS